MIYYEIDSKTLNGVNELYDGLFTLAKSNKLINRRQDSFCENRFHAVPESKDAPEKNLPERKPGLKKQTEPIEAT